EPGQQGLRAPRISCYVDRLREHVAVLEPAQHHAVEFGGIGGLVGCYLKQLARRSDLAQAAHGDTATLSPEHESRQQVFHELARRAVKIHKVAVAQLGQRGAELIRQLPVGIKHGRSGARRGGELYAHDGAPPFAPDVTAARDDRRRRWISSKYTTTMFAPATRKRKASLACS